MTTFDFATIRRILAIDPVWSAYALADLQPAFLPYTHWTVGQSVDGDGLVLLFTALTPPILVTIGPAAAVAAALAQTALPEQIFISAREEHYAPLAAFYDFGDRLHSMWRMVPQTKAQVAMPLVDGLVRLNFAHGEQLEKLYASGGEFAPSFFDRYQLQDGVYFGVTAETGALLAAGGTHILARQEGVAAIGNIYTRPDQRGKGYAGTIFQAIVTTLQAEGFSNIFLNVDQRNATARKLYERYGFTVYCPFIEGTGLKR